MLVFIKLIHEERPSPLQAALLFGPGARVREEWRRWAEHCWALTGMQACRHAGMHSLCSGLHVTSCIMFLPWLPCSDHLCFWTVFWHKPLALCALSTRTFHLSNWMETQDILLPLLPDSLSSENIYSQVLCQDSEIQPWSRATENGPAVSCEARSGPGIAIDELHSWPWSG